MKYINRYKLNQINSVFTPGKVVVLYGARRVGKTTLVSLLKDHYEDGEYLELNGDFPGDRELMIQRTETKERLVLWLGNRKVLFIDEAQSIENIGSILKRIVDALPHLKIIASGSASFELSQQVGEPLVGRSRVLRLFPLSWTEVYDRQPSQQQLEDLLIFGAYPSVVTAESYEQKRAEIGDIVNGQLLKDALNLEGLRDSSKVRDLLKLLAFQVGSEVSMSELARSLALPRAQVERYLDLFEKCFILFRLGGFSRNLRKEIAKSSKYYFWDIGVRNAIIGNFNSLGDRDDVGALWENALIVETMKRGDRIDPMAAAGYYFWRTYDHQKIDLVSEQGVKLAATEFKYAKTVKAPRGFTGSYPDATFSCVNKDNYWHHVS
jgi:uncharacterized protein